MKKLTILLTLTILFLSSSGCCPKIKNPCPEWPEASEGTKKRMGEHLTAPEDIAWGNKMVKLKKKLMECRGE